MLNVSARFVSTWLKKLTSRNVVTVFGKFAAYLLFTGLCVLDLSSSECCNNRNMYIVKFSENYVVNSVKAFWCLSWDVVYGPPLQSTEWHIGKETFLCLHYLQLYYIVTTLMPLKLQTVYCCSNLFVCLSVCLSVSVSVCYHDYFTCIDWSLPNKFSLFW